MASKKNRDLYNRYAAICAPDDFWGQVRRTVNGKVVDQKQIEMIVDAVVSRLEVQQDDVLLDLCCGNGALSDRLFEKCRGGVGVDFAERLIDIAKTHFQRIPDRVYVVGDVEDFASSSTDTAPFTKALCYGSFPLLTHEAARTLLRAIRTRFSGIRAFFIGNIPDKALMADFYYEGAYVPGLEDDPESPIGIWRTEREFAQLAAETGWEVTFSRMPPGFYARSRYDALLTPLEKRAD